MAGDATSRSIGSKIIDILLLIITISPLIRQSFFVIVKDCIHIFDPNGVHRSIKPHPLAIFRITNLGRIRRIVDTKLLEPHQSTHAKQGQTDRTAAPS